MSDQLLLPLVPLADRSEGYEARHQVGQFRTPWTWATGPHRDAATPQAGDLVPAWRCCACGGIEMTRYALEREHNCCGHTFLPYCQNPTNRPLSAYRMDAHWLPPAGWSTPDT